MITTQLKPPRNWTERASRLNKILQIIIENPEHHDQSNWHCGTSHCFAGTTQLVARKLSIKTCVLNEDNEVARNLCKQFKLPSVEGNSSGIETPDIFLDAQEDAQTWLGLTENEAGSLFQGGNRLSDLKKLVKQLSKPQKISLAKYLKEDKELNSDNW